MKPDIMTLRRERSDQITEMTDLVASAEEKGRELNEDEEKKFEELFNRAESLKNRIERLEKVETLNRDINTIDEQPQRPSPEPEPKENGNGDYPFKSIGEILYTARFNRRDSRLKAALDMNVGESGGYMVPPEFRDTMLELATEPPVVRPRATVIPAGDMPDQEIQMPALNQNAASNMYGGVEFKWTKSGTTKQETDLEIRKVALKPEEYAAWIPVSDQLLRNWSAANAVIERLFRDAAIAHEDDNFLTAGDGVGKPQSVLNDPSVFAVNRAVANQVAYADLRAMYVRRYGTPVWVVNPEVIDQFMSMEDTGGSLIWQPNAREGTPNTLFGLPVVESPRSPALGSKGDVMLCDFSYYLIKDGSGPFIASSEHFKFTDNVTVIKFFANVDGQSWLTETITGEGGYVQSPFVVLDVPA